MAASDDTIFDAQVERLLCVGYPAALDISERSLRRLVEPLRRVFCASLARRSPCVLVVPAAPEAILPRIPLPKGRAFVDLRPKRAPDFQSIDGLGLPRARAYVLSGIDCGADLRGVTPEAALRRIRARRRSPLTIDEGVALLVQQPDVVREHSAFSLLGSRCGDQRVPAIWNSRVKGRVGTRLGWCWERNPHSWLGSASCSGRAGPL